LGRLRKHLGGRLSDSPPDLLDRDPLARQVELHTADEGAGTGHNVRDVQDSPLVEQAPMAGAGQDVIRGSHDRAALQPLEGQVVQDAPQCAWREDVARRFYGVARVHEPQVAGLGHEFRALWVDVRSDDLRPRLDQARCQLTSDLTEALDHDRTPIPVDGPVQMLKGGSHAPEDSRARRLGDLAGPGGSRSRGEGRLLRDPSELLGRCSNVGPDVEPPLVPIDDPAQVPVGGLEIESLAIHDDDLCAPHRQLRQGAFVGHRLAQAQAIQEGLAFIPVGPAPDTAERGPARGVVESQEGPEARFRVVDRVDLLEPAPGHRVEDVDRHGEINDGAAAGDGQWVVWSAKRRPTGYTTAPAEFLDPGKTLASRSSTDPKMIRPHATGRRPDLITCLPLLMLLLGCSSSAKGRNSGIPHDPNVLEVQRENLRDGPMGPLLATLDKEVRAWNALSLSADTDQKRRQVVILEQSLQYQANLRLDDLVAELQSRSVFNRMVAAVVLGFSTEDPDLGPEALGPLVAALDDPSPEVESNVLLGLGILAHEDTPPGPLEDRLLHSSNPAARGNAALALRKIIEAGATSDSVVSTAQTGLIDSEPSVRSQCAILLASQLDTESIDKLEVLLHDDVPLVTLASARALAYIGSNVPSAKGECARALTRALDQVSPEMKTGILRTLMRMSRSNYGKDTEAWNDWARRLP